MIRLNIFVAIVVALFVVHIPVISAHAQGDNTVIRIGNLDLGPYLPVAYVAKIAEKYGIKVKISPFRRSLEIASAVKAGELDVGVGGIEAVVVALATGTPAVVISGISNKGVGWVGRSDIKWTSLRDLKGKRFATIHGLHELVARTIIENAGLTTSREPGKADVQLLLVPSSPQLVTALKLRQADATSAPEPFPSRAVAEGYAVPILTPAQVYGTKLGTFPRAIYMRSDFIKQHPKVAQGFVDALTEATKTFRDNPKIARDFALNDQLKDTISAEDWDIAEKNQDWDVDLSAASVQAFIDQMARYRVIDAPLDAGKLTDLSML